MTQNKELINLQLTETSPSAEPSVVKNILKDIGEALPGMFVDLSGSGTNWFRGKSAQEVAKAQEILSGAIDRIGRLQLDEREQIHRHQLERANHLLEANRKQQELYFGALDRVVKIVKDLAEAGIQVDLRTFVDGIPQHISAIESPFTKLVNTALEDT